jgi:hypothetical protein
MHWTNLSLTAAMATAVLVLLPINSATPHDVFLGEEPCPVDLDDSSCNLAFRNENGLTGLTTAELNQTVFQSCGFPNGPYRRLWPADAAGPIDYVTLKLSTPTTGGMLLAGTIYDQIGTNVVSGVSVTVDGSFGNNDANITIEDTSAMPSQILDLGGFDFVLFEKSSGGGGGQMATLVCDLNMWFRDGGVGDPVFGLHNFAVDHGVNEITIGWVAGPSGHFSQTNAVEACALADDPNLEQSLSYLVGSYKSTTDDPVSIINVTGCGLDSEGESVRTSYCDAGEVAGSLASPRPNACNPDGEIGGLPDLAASGVNGSASTCYFSSRGTPVAFPC